MKNIIPTQANSKLKHQPAPLTTTGDLRRSLWMAQTTGQGRVVKMVNPATQVTQEVAK